MVRRTILVVFINSTDKPIGFWMQKLSKWPKVYWKFISRSLCHKEKHKAQSVRSTTSNEQISSSRCQVNEQIARHGLSPSTEHNNLSCEKEGSMIEPRSNSCNAISEKPIVVSISLSAECSNANNTCEELTRNFFQLIVCVQIENHY